MKMKIQNETSNLSDLTHHKCLNCNNDVENTIIMKDYNKNIPYTEGASHLIAWKLNEDYGSMSEKENANLSSSSYFINDEHLTTALNPNQSAIQITEYDLTSTISDVSISSSSFNYACPDVNQVYDLEEEIENIPHFDGSTTFSERCEDSDFY